MSMSERIASTAEDLAYAALDSDDPALNLADLGWTAGDYLEPYGGQPGGYLSDIVLTLIRDLRKGDETHKSAIAMLLLLGSRVVEATANCDRCIAEAHADVINSFLVEE